MYVYIYIYAIYIYIYAHISVHIYIHMYIYETCGVVPCFPVKKFPFKPSLASTKGHKKCCPTLYWLIPSP